MLRRRTIIALVAFYSVFWVASPFMMIAADNRDWSRWESWVATAAIFAFGYVSWRLFCQDVDRKSKVNRDEPPLGVESWVQHAEALRRRDDLEKEAQQ